MDLEKEIPHLNIPKQERDVMWDDSLHLTPAGYDKFGSLLFDLLKASNTLPGCVTK